MIRSLWVKLVGAFVIVNLLSLVIILSLVIRATEQEFGQYTDARRDFVQSFISTRAPVITRLALPVIPNARDIEDTLPGPRDPLLQGALETVIGDDARLSYNSDLDAYVVEVAADPVTDNQFLVDTRRAATLAIVIAGGVSILLGTILFRQITRPLHKLRSAVNQYAQGDLSVRTPVKSSDEVGRLAVAFNQMAEELEKQEDLRQQMVADVAHELRTPLSVMRGNIEAMMDGLLIPNKVELAYLQDEVQRLTRLIDDLRLLSQADAGQLRLNISRIDVIRLISQIVALMKPLADENIVELQVRKGQASLKVLGDEDRLQQAVINLIENAIRNSPQGASVQVTAVVSEARVCISVTDECPGIPDADLPHIFDRFWRGDKSRGRGGGGSGLGLSIVKQIVDLHDGTIQVERLKSGGSRFSICLPAESQG
ncbi:MAG: ATP-binding protein [Candidatus Promineifilaceae bacterium]